MEHGKRERAKEEKEFREWEGNVKCVRTRKRWWYPLGLIDLFLWTIAVCVGARAERMVCSETVLVVKGERAELSTQHKPLRSFERRRKALSESEQSDPMMLLPKNIKIKGDKIFINFPAILPCERLLRIFIALFFPLLLCCCMGTRSTRTLPTTIRNRN